MKPFDPTKPVQYRNGEKARIRFTDGNATYSGTKHPIVSEGEDGVLRTHQTNGKWGIWDDKDNYDLINIPEKRKLEMWVNVYGGKDFCHPSVGHYSKTKADESASNGRIACLHIVREYEEGEGL